MLAPHMLAVPIAVTVGAGLTITSLQVADAYQIPSLRAAVRSSRTVLIAWSVGFAAIIVQLLLMRLELHLWTCFAWYLAGGGLILIVRQFLAFGIRHWARDGTMERRAVIVGGGAPAKELVRALEGQSDNDIRICGIFDDRGSARSRMSWPVIQSSALCRTGGICAARPDRHADYRPACECGATHPAAVEKALGAAVDIRLAAHSTRLRFRPRAYSHVGDVPMLDIFDKPIRDWDSVAKRIFDIFFSALALAVFWPVMLAAAIAVKATSKGPVLFVRKRHGFNNEIINVLKFRSMYTELADPTAKKAVTKNDPRVTPVGRFLRKSSLDELPQLFNVLKGDLSLVAPAPMRFMRKRANASMWTWSKAILPAIASSPGVTGWAQINGLRGELDSDEKIRKRTAYDLDYIENWSLLLDLKILFLTPIRLLNTENAY